MALEDLTGNKYIDDLVPTWPLDTDSRGQGAGHIRGVKNVLRSSFPNVSGPVTLTQQEINGAAFPAGTRMLFQQTAAPTGWVKATDQNDKALRVVSGSAVGGGSVPFSTALGTGGTTGAHTLTEAEMPAHTHNGSGLDVTTAPHSHAAPSGSASYLTQGVSGISGYFAQQAGGFAFKTAQIPNTTVLAGITGSTGSAGSGSAHTHPMNIDVAYTDVIVAVKS